MSLVIRFIIAAFFLFPSTVFAGYAGDWGTSGSAPWIVTSDAGGTISCAQADVEAAISNAAIEDVIYVGWDGATPQACTATWTSQMTITKAVQLIAAGNGVAGFPGTDDTYYDTYTQISSTWAYPSSCPESSTACYSPRYIPDASSRNFHFRMSGFDFDYGSGEGPGFSGEDAAQPIILNPATNMRFDHNIVRAYGDELVKIRYHIYGVFDHNLFDRTGTNTDGISFFGTGSTDWDYGTYTYGTANAMYFEDNVFLFGNGYAGDTFDCTNGASFVSRYNTFKCVNCQYHPVHNMHGNSDNWYSCMAEEVYGNDAEISGTAGPSLMNTQRGGKVISFNNYINNRGSPTSPPSGSTAGMVTVQDRGDQCSDDQDSNGIDDGCDQNKGTPYGGPEGQPQYPSDSYYWSNTWGSNGTYKWQASCTSDYSNSGGGSHNCPVMNPPNTVVPAAESEFWAQYPQTGQTQESFDGTRGIGCGTIGSRPATCTTGVAYWATTQSCTDLTGMIGADASTPISGTLYKCTSTDTWTEYYTPYTYPHPLTSSVGSVSGTVAADAMTESTIVSGGATIVIHIINDTLVPDDGTFAAARQAVINGMDSAQSEANGWDAEVKAKEVVGAVVRTDDTHITVTLSAAAAYTISADETITVTIPASVLVTSSDPVVATPSFTIANENPVVNNPQRHGVYSSGGHRGWYSSNGPKGVKQ